MTIRTTVIIPNYNGLEFLGPCLDSLRAQTADDFTVLVVDNGSTDGSVEWLRENNVPSVLMPENTGFCAAVNTGIKASETKYVILLNNDTIASPEFVAELESVMERGKNVFSANSMMVRYDDPERIDDAGDMYSIMGWAYQRGIDHPVKEYFRPCRIFASCGGASIYRRDVFEEIGYFDEMHFAYLEDIDIGYRAKLYGYENVYCPDAVVRHIGSATSGSKYNPFKVRISARNNIYLNYKNMSNWQLIVNSPALTAGIIVKGVFFAKQGYLKDYLGGLFEGIRTAGKCSRVPVMPGHLKEEVRTESELILGTIIYVYEFFSRQIAKRTKK